MSTHQAVVLPFPVSLNNAYTQNRNGRRFRSKNYTAWCNAAIWAIKLAKLKPMSGPVHIQILMNPPDHRRRDIDNLTKGCIDSLVKARIIPDDNSSVVQKITSEWRLPFDTANPGATVVITAA